MLRVVPARKSLGRGNEEVRPCYAKPFYTPLRLLVQNALVGTAEGLTRRDLVPFGDHLLDGEIGIWEGLAKHGRELLDTLTVRRHSRWRAVFRNSGEQSSSRASMLPRLCTSSTKRRTIALFSSVDIEHLLCPLSGQRATPSHTDMLPPTEARRIS
jgi:hypothetical protein